MPTSFFQYEMLPTTWFYLSALIILAIFFKFNRFWSVRNLDLIGLIMFTPGLLLLAMRDDQWGYLWFFSIGLLMAVRLVFDTVMVRRPLLEPNLTPGGLTFACFFLVLFIFAAITVNRGDQLDTVRTIRLDQILTTRHLQKGIGMNPSTLTIPRSELSNLPPGFRPFWAFTERTNLALAPPAKIREEILEPSVPGRTTIASNPSGTLTIENDPSKFPEMRLPAGAGQVSNIDKFPLNPPTVLSEETPILDRKLDLQPLIIRIDEESSEVKPADPIALRPSFPMLSLIMTAAIVSHLSIVFALIYIGHCHFGNIRTGVACATLYLLLPYTNQLVGCLDHLVPAALILWSVAMYRRPFFAGLWIGSAAALVFYPIFLVPLWCSYYMRRGWVRFLSGCLSAMVVFVLLLLLSPASLGGYGEQLLHMFGKSSFWIFIDKPDGFWTDYDDMIYRVPVMAIYFTLCLGMFLWPAHKHLATLLSCSSLLMLGVQFWQLHQGGLYMAWYLPLLILTVFRPNLEDRVAQTSVVP